MAINTAARSNRSSRSMVRQAHHDRLDHPLVLSFVEGYASFKAYASSRFNVQKFNVRFSEGKLHVFRILEAAKCEVRHEP